MAEFTFEEVQKFRQFWIWILILGVFGVFAYGIITQVFMGIPFGDHPAPDEALLLTGIIPFLLLWMMLKIKLETRVDREGIHYRFFPFLLKTRDIPWDDIDRAYVRKYSPLWEYGGWGMRYGRFGSGRAYNISGNKGLQILLRNGKKILIGTRRPEELEEVLANINRYSGRHF